MGYFIGFPTLFIEKSGRLTTKQCGIDASKHSAYDSGRRRGSSNDDNGNNKSTLHSRKSMDAASRVSLQKSQDQQADSG